MEVNYWYITLLVLFLILSNLTSYRIGKFIENKESFQTIIQVNNTLSSAKQELYNQKAETEKWKDLTTKLLKMKGVNHVE